MSTGKADAAVEDATDVRAVDAAPGGAEARGGMTSRANDAVPPDSGRSADAAVSPALTAIADAPGGLRLDNVSLSYGGFRALDGISLHVLPGELVVLLGANGAGKSSIFLTISGLHRAAGGSIRFGERELVGMKPSQVVEFGVVQCPEGRKLFPGMSVLKNLNLGAYVHRGDAEGNAQRLAEVFELFPILDEKREDPAGSLSGGQQQMVAIGRALMGRPKALLLDEPSLGLAPLVVKQVFDVIHKINAAGTTVLLAEQNAYAALKIAHRAYVIESGRIVLEGDPDSLLGNPTVRRAYIGA